MILLINGWHVLGNQTMLALLARLFDNLGTVIPYELCLSIGHKSANSALTHVLRQYVARLRDQLAHSCGGRKSPQRCRGLSLRRRRGKK